MTLDDGVAAAFERFRGTRNTGPRALVNEVLREGLKQMNSLPPRREPFQTRPVDLGRPLTGSLDSIGVALTISEGEAFK